MKRICVAFVGGMARRFAREVLSELQDRVTRAEACRALNADDSAAEAEHTGLVIILESAAKISADKSCGMSGGPH